MFGVFKKVFGTKSERDRKKFEPIVDQINEEFEKLSPLSNDELREQTNLFKAQIKDHLEEIENQIQEIRTTALNTEDVFEKEDLFKQMDALVGERDLLLEEILLEIRPKAFAVVKEAARRFTLGEDLSVTATTHDRELAAKPGKSYVKIEGDKAVYHKNWLAAGGEIEWNMIHYDVQLIGGMVLHDGKIAEMQTGEGKTLVATLPAYLNGLSGYGVHVVTVNDYLAKRDSEWIGPLLEFLLLTVDCIDKYQPHSPERIAAYKCDVIYGTNNEFGFDYLRDNMVTSPEEKVQRKHHFAMVDEVDSVLIDDARTPLIISGPVPQNNEIEEYINLKSSVERLINEQKKLANSYLTEAKKLFAEGVVGHDEGQMGMAILRAHRAFPKHRPLIKFKSEEGVRTILQKAENFYMAEKEKRMYLVDDPLLFTISEANRNVELTDKGIEFLSQGNSSTDFFMIPDLAGEMMTIESRSDIDLQQKEALKTELAQEYTVKTQRLHAINQLVKAYTLFDKGIEYDVQNSEVKIIDESTGRVMEGRRYSDGLHQALEAKENVKIGNITQTYATITLQNYFRMYHKLSGMTGTAETEAGEFWEIYKLDVVVIPTNKPIARQDKNDLVFKTEREKVNAVINQIIEYSQAGRPVLVGTTTVDMSERLSKLLKLKGINHNVLNARQHQREAEIVAEAGKPGKVTIATNMAGRGTDIKLSQEVKDAGGLAIIGTERHDSRRVDRQLRGRSGRQGDPGSSQFYVSLEDDLMRKFQSERLIKYMDSLGHKEGDVLEHSMVTRSIEKAQKRVEENNFGVRKRLLEYDDVMNIQRSAIYTKRNNALSGDRLEIDLNSMFTSIISNIVEIYKGRNNYEDFKQASLSFMGFTPDISEEVFANSSTQEVQDLFAEQFDAFLNRKEEQIIGAVYPQAKRVYDTQGNRYKRIAIPYTDGSNKRVRVSAELESAVETEGKSIVKDIKKTISLAIIDNKWKEHLRSMDELKETSRAAQFAQKDPLVEYKLGAYDQFENLILGINEDVTSYLAKGTIMFADGSSLSEAKEQKVNMGQTNKSQEEILRRRAAMAAGRENRRPETFKREEKKVGRNEPCPCGSGKKYKQCHGK